MTAKLVMLLLSFSLSAIVLAENPPSEESEPKTEKHPESKSESDTEALAQTPSKSESSPSSLDKLEGILKEAIPDLKGTKGRWTFTFEDVSIAVITDVNHDRMRIVAPIVEVEKLESRHYKRMLEANFHTALDARYAISNNIVYAAFIHPLSPLHDTEFASALLQVANLAKSFGTSYSSGALSYLEKKVSSPGSADR